MLNIPRIKTNFFKYPRINDNIFIGLIDKFQNSDVSKQWLIDYHNFESIGNLRNKLYNSFLEEDAVLFMLDMHFRWDIENRPKAAPANIRNSKSYIAKINDHKIEIPISKIKNLLDDFPYDIYNQYNKKELDNINKSLKKFPSFTTIENNFNKIVNYKLNWLKPNKPSNVNPMMFLIYYFCSPIYDVSYQMRYDLFMLICSKYKKSSPRLAIVKFMNACKNLIKSFNLLDWIDVFKQYHHSDSKAKHKYYDINEILITHSKIKNKIKNYKKSYILAKNEPYKYFQFLNVIAEKSFLFTDLWFEIYQLINNQNAYIWFDVLFDSYYYTEGWEKKIDEIKEERNFSMKECFIEQQWGLFATYETQMKNLEKQS